MRIKQQKLSLGIGINDADYVVNGNNVFCPIYKKWYAMLTRCYNKSHPNYIRYGAIGTRVCDEWLRYSNFKAWMEQKAWDTTLHLDKDILVGNNLLYSAETCCLVPSYINQLLAKVKSTGASGILGVIYINPTFDMKAASLTKPWSSMRSVVDNKSSRGGLYATAEEAHKRWQIDKATSIEYAINRWATDSKYSIYFDTKVADALTARVWKLRLDASTGSMTTSI